MPKIIQYEPNQVQTQIVNQPKARSAPAAAFGGDIAAGLTDVAKATFDMKNRIDTTSAEEALVKFERDKNDTFFNPDTGYFNTQGKNAYDSSINTTKALEDLKKSYGESLNPEAKRMFDAVADKHITKSNVDIARHASKGLKAWEISTIEAQVENSLENASLYWQDPKALGVQNVLGRQAIIDSSDMLGDSPEAKAEKLQTFESAFASSTIAAATANSSVLGKEALDKYGSKLEGPDKIKLESAIVKKAKVEKTQADANAAVLTAGRLNSQYTSRQDIINEVNKIEDPELRKKTMTESILQYNNKKTARKEIENEHYNTSIDLVNQGLTPMQIQAQNPAAWEGMDDKQRNNILSGKHQITDQVLFNKLRTLPNKEKAKLNAVDYASDLKPKDLQKLTTEINAAKKGNQGSRVKSLSAKSMAAAEAAFGKKAKWTRGTGKATEKGKAANEFLSDLQDAIDEAETDKQGKLTPAEEDKLIAEFTRQIVVERSAFGFDILASDTEIDLSNTPPNEVRMLNQIIDNTPTIDVADLTDAYKFLVDNKKPVTPENLRTVYDQGRK